jgi:NADH-quinone oxidoreductase subunit N
MISNAISPIMTTPSLVLACTLLISGLAFKLGLAPFHLWLPDVYQGAPRATVTIFALVPKLALLIVLAKFLYTFLSLLFTIWAGLLYVIALISVLIGTLGGLNQTSFLRMLAYSTITDMGYIFIALSYGDFLALHAVLVYFLIHTLSSVTVFSLLTHAHTVDNYSLFSSIKDFSFFKSQTHMHLTPIIAMVSYMSIPPLAGFLGKAYIFGILITHNQYLTVLLLCTAFLGSTFFYARIIQNLLFHSEYQFALFSTPEDLSYADLFLMAIFNSIFILVINNFVTYTVVLTQYFFISTQL